MHRTRRKTTIEPAGFADRLTEWLLTHCPFSTLTVLAVIVIGPTLPALPEPLRLAVPVVLADGLFNLGRRLLRPERAQRVEGSP